MKQAKVHRRMNSNAVDQMINDNDIQIIILIKV